MKQGSSKRSRPQPPPRRATVERKTQQEASDRAPVYLLQHLLNGYPYNEMYYYPRELLAETYAPSPPAPQALNHQSVPRVYNYGSIPSLEHQGIPRVIEYPGSNSRHHNSPTNYNYDYVRWMTRYGTRWHK